MDPQVSGAEDADTKAPLLVCQNLMKTFNAGVVGARPALNGLTLAVDQGDFVVIIGSNGAGKSSLLNIIAGAIQPDSGTLQLGGLDITRLPAHRRAGQIARVFQDPMVGTAAAMTIEENLALAERRGRRHGFAFNLTSAKRRRYRDLLGGLALGMEDRLSTPVAELSGGQRQALSLVMASLSNPALLLLDEHTAALDPRTADLVMAMTTRLVAEQSLTALMVTHNMRQAIETGNRLVMMDAGRVRDDIRGEEKASLSPTDLVEKFKIENDRMLLGS